MTPEIVKLAREWGEARKKYIKAHNALTAICSGGSVEAEHVYSSEFREVEKTGDIVDDAEALLLGAIARWVEEFPSAVILCDG